MMPPIHVRLTLYLTLILALILALIGSDVAAQGPDDIQTLVDAGYLASPDGELIIEVDQQTLSALPNTVEWDRFGVFEVYGDVVLSATVTWTGNAGGCGFVFRQQGLSSYYLTALYTDNTLLFAENRYDEWQDDTITSFDVANMAPTSNDLLLIAQGDTFTVLVNGELAGEWNNAARPEGKYALFADSTDCTFDDIWLWEITGLDAGTGNETAEAPTDEQDSSVFGFNLPQATSTPRPSAAPTARPAPTATPNPGRPADSSLTHYDGTMEEVIAELEARAVIPSGGSEIFREDYAYFEGTGNWFVSLARDRPHTNYVMGGELTFTIGTFDEYEQCSLISRIQMNPIGDAHIFLDAGLFNEGTAYITDYVDGELIAFELSESQVDLRVPHQLLIIVLGDQATLYLDGERVLHNVRVSERAGIYGIGLNGFGPDARCEGRDIWAWELDAAVAFEDGCGVIAPGNVNLRTGPGTQYSRAGTLTAGQSAVVMGQATDADGFVWWQVHGGYWVRSDVVNTGGDCSVVPTVTP